jgi:hypothetical protein
MTARERFVEAMSMILRHTDASGAPAQCARMLRQAVEAFAAQACGGHYPCGTQMDAKTEHLAECVAPLLKACGL